MEDGQDKGASAAELQRKVSLLTQELDEAREQQAATGKILGVIASSPGDVQPVLAAIAESAARLCQAFDAIVRLKEGDALVFGAHYGPIPVDPKAWAISRKWTGGRSVVDRATIHVHDLADAAEEFPEGWAMAHRFGHRTTLAVPLLREGEAIGTMMLRRMEVKPFSEAQISVLRTFADQAVIAIENAHLFEEVRARNRELSETLEQQVATSAILRAIAASPTEIQPVLNAVTENAAQLCDAHDTTLFLRRADILAVAMHRGAIPLDFAEWPITRDFVAGRAVLDQTPVHVHDVTAESEFPESRMLALRFGFRTILATPLLREGEAIGALVIRRVEMRPFSARQIELLKTFADQAVIAIENVRLFEEVQARTRDLTEALEQQTAASEILRVIARSPTEVQPVFDTIATSVARLCGARYRVVFRFDGELVHFVAEHGLPPEGVAGNRQAYPMPPGRGSAAARSILNRTVEQIPDVEADPDFTHTATTRAVKVRSLVAVPMLKDDVPAGAIVVARPQTGLFPDRQVELVQTFADQAVIAIENVRLFEEVQARTRELSDSLQQQTAAADVLKVISRSAFDLQAVLNTLVESAARVCEAEWGTIFQREGDVYHFAASYGLTTKFGEYARANPHVPGRDSLTGRVALEAKTVHIEDMLADPEYRAVGYQQLATSRTGLGVPLLREGLPIGVFVLTRSIVKPFTGKQIELVETFADQAVIAIENVRLFEEVQARTAELSEALQQQTATADVLKVISRSAVDLELVLQTLVESAARLCDADKATITRQIGGRFYRAQAYGFSPEFVDRVRAIPVEPERGSVSGRALLEGKVVHITDVAADPEYTFAEAQKLGGVRTVLGVPMLREGVPIGVMSLTRSEVRPFTDKQIELVSTFADQAAIAIENARLFEEVQARTQELSHSLEDLRTAQGRLVQTEKLASLGQLTAGIAHEIKNPLNFVNNFSSLSGELIDELREGLADVPLDAKKRSEIVELVDMLQNNLEKVVQHGKRADSIVKNMLLHSRAGSGEHRPTDINAIVEEALNLAYHGARAEKQGFNITIEKSLDPAAGEVDLFPQEITRVLLNLISNGFYAATKRKALTDGGYEPVLAAATRNLGDSVEVLIRDNGTGIPPEVKEKMFNPFFTTKPAGEGTGLGLSLSHDIIVKQHAGTIEVETEPDVFTEFRIVLPRGGASIGKSGGNA